jgi:hypothetical protein
MAKKFEDLTPGEKLEKITGTKNVVRPPYDPSNPHTEYNHDDPVTNALYVKMMNDPVEREKYQKKLDEYDAAQRAKKSNVITAKDVEDTVKARKQPMGTIPKGGMPFEDDMGPLPGKKYKKGGSVSSASKRADGIATKGKTKGRIV